ncbi:MAG: ThiF family adenylyltransferase [Acidobacteriia bacterium]|nr:ThiF family adenylyltransferase [Terriglobia bacterium]
MENRRITLVTNVSLNTLLTPVDGRERAAVLFIAGIAETTDSIELFCPRVYKPREDDYHARYPWLCVLKADALIANVLEPLGQEQGIVHIHDHGTGPARFSEIDDRGLDDKLMTTRTRRPGAWFVRGVLGGDGVTLEAYPPESMAPVPVDFVKTITASHGLIWTRTLNSRRAEADAPRVDAEIYQRTIAALGGDPERVLGALACTRVGIVGVGGIGSVVAQLLPHLGIRTLTLVDDDRVERSNRNRWVLYKTGAEGEPKVIAARERLLEAHPDVQVEGIVAEFPSTEAEAALKKCDVVICCPDNNWTRYWAERFAARHMKVSLSMGSGIDVGPGGLHAIGAQLRAFVPMAGGRCAVCQGMDISNLSPPAVERLHRQTGYTVARSVVTINSAIASVAAGWLFAWFSGRERAMPTYLEYDEIAFSIRNLGQVFEPQSGCHICGAGPACMVGRGDEADDCGDLLTSPEIAEAVHGTLD